MNYNQIKSVLDNARKLGLKTLGDLMNYKKARGIKDNYELWYWLKKEAANEV